MSLTALIDRPCTITRRSSASGTIDDYGGEIPSEQTVETVCQIQQIRRVEPGGDGELSITDWVGFFLPGEVLSTADLVTVDDGDYEVVGDPWQAQQGSPSVWHVEATLRKVSGADDEVGS